DGKMVFAGTHGWAYGVKFDDWRKAWEAPMAYSAYCNVHLQYLGGALYAGSNGTVLELNPSTGVRLREKALTKLVGEEVRMTTDGRTLAVGCVKYVTGLRLNDNWKDPAWETELSGTLRKQVEVASQNGHVFAVSNGYAHRLEMSTGKIKNAMSLS